MTPSKEVRLDRQWAFTPGPWVVQHGKVFGHLGGVYITRDVSAERRGYVARMDGSTHAALEQDANARLIAAAPMLFEAASDALDAFKNLREGMAFLPDDPLAVELIDAHIDELEFAIARATGGAQ